MGQFCRFWGNAALVETSAVHSRANDCLGVTSSAAGGPACWAQHPAAGGRPRAWTACFERGPAAWLPGSGLRLGSRQLAPAGAGRQRCQIGRGPCPPVPLQQTPLQQREHPVVPQVSSTRHGFSVKHSPAILRVWLQPTASKTAHAEAQVHGMTSPVGLRPWLCHKQVRAPPTADVQERLGAVSLAACCSLKTQLGRGPASTHDLWHAMMLAWQPHAACRCHHGALPQPAQRPAGTFPASDGRPTLRQLLHELIEALRQYAEVLVCNVRWDGSCRASCTC